MTRNSNTTSEPVAEPGKADVWEAFDTIKKCLVIFGVMSGIVLATDAAVALAHGPVSSFMWVRAGIMLLVAPVLYRLAARASHGAQKAFDRLRTVSLILPIAIIVVDLIPGVAPAWYAGMQGVSALAVLGVAVMMRRGALRAHAEIS